MRAAILCREYLSVTLTEYGDFLTCNDETSALAGRDRRDRAEIKYWYRGVVRHFRHPVFRQCKAAAVNRAHALVKSKGFTDEGKLQDYINVGCLKSWLRRCRGMGISRGSARINSLRRRFKQPRIGVRNTLIGAIRR